MAGKETLPLRSIDELLLWRPPTLVPKPQVLQHRSRCAISGKALGGKFENLFSSGSHSRDFPRTLLCHDLMGGYLEDRHLPPGATRLTREPYVFTRWSAVDVFVYFSHHFITIPPFSWIDAGHKHGVQVLGTIITEWDAGKELCRQMILHKDSFIDKCVELAVSLGFDGWLFNIENGLEKEDAVKMRDLLREFADRMHEAVPNSQVIWYDSVTKDGELKWQNELNELNSGFFDACDGIFLNYTWSEKNLDASLGMAQGREKDVYVGIDVFGRGCFGGGGLDTVDAVKVVRQRSMSMALFAPSWTYESTVIQNDCDSFVAREFEFWSLLRDYLYFRGLTFRFDDVRTVSAQESHCVFTSCFKTGRGSNGEWWWLDLTRQEFQGTFHVTKVQSEQKEPDYFISSGCLLHHDGETTEERGLSLTATGADYPTTIPLLLFSLSGISNQDSLSFELSVEDDVERLTLALLSSTEQLIEVEAANEKGLFRFQTKNLDPCEAYIVGIKGISNGNSVKMNFLKVMK